MSTYGEEKYLELLEECLTQGDRRQGRNGGTRGLFGRQLRFDLEEGFPLLTTKKVPFKPALLELLWLVSGDTSAKTLEDQGVTIWKEWGDPETRDLGPIYGKQWRNWSGVASNGKPRRVDQLLEVQEGLRKDPFGRRHIVSAWNPADVPDMALPPCHAFFQFHVSSDFKLSCHMTQRSADIFLGVPFNIASYALLTHMMAITTGYRVGDLIISFGDVHLYDNHEDQASEQVFRHPKAPPRIIMNRQVKSIENFIRGDFTLVDYDPEDAIRAPVSA